MRDYITYVIGSQVD